MTGRQHEAFHFHYLPLEPALLARTVWFTTLLSSGGKEFPKWPYR